MERSSPLDQALTRNSLPILWLYYRSNIQNINVVCYTKKNQNTKQMYVNQIFTVILGIGWSNVRMASHPSTSSSKWNIKWASKLSSQSCILVNVVVISATTKVGNTNSHCINMTSLLWPTKWMNYYFHLFELFTTLWW